MWTIVIGAIVSLLVFFFERWWTAHHPINPTPAKQAFLDEVGKLRHCWMGPNRQKYAAALFDKFVARYNQAPPKMSDHDAPLTSDQAKAIASLYASGLTLTQDEAKTL